MMEIERRFTQMKQIYTDDKEKKFNKDIQNIQDKNTGFYTLFLSYILSILSIPVKIKESL